MSQIDSLLRIMPDTVGIGPARRLCKIHPPDIVQGSDSNKTGYSAHIGNLSLSRHDDDTQEQGLMID